MTIDFRRIPLDDIDLQREIRLDDESSVDERPLSANSDFSFLATIRHDCSAARLLVTRYVSYVSFSSCVVCRCVQCGIESSGLAGTVSGRTLQNRAPIARLGHSCLQTLDGRREAPHLLSHEQQARVTRGGERALVLVPRWRRTGRNTEGK